ncbi:MAG: hypothetical protein PHS88_02100, partial [Candidatus Omnitrophica bacterium]|nr:hypothetical protein [Candidatus Omnitrophota bacterium]
CALPICFQYGVAAVAVNWKIFGSSGETEKTDGLVMERFKKCSLRNFHANRNYKTIARPNLLAGFVTCHRVRVKNGSYLYLDGKKVKKECTGKGEHIDHKTIQLNHYFTKSRTEWEAKRERGRAPFPPEHPKRIRPNDIFLDLDRNEIEDLTILQFSEKTKIEMESLRKAIAS